MESYEEEFPFKKHPLSFNHFIQQCQEVAKNHKGFAIDQWNGLIYGLTGVGGVSIDFNGVMMFDYMEDMKHFIESLQPRAHMTFNTTLNPYVWYIK